MIWCLTDFLLLLNALGFMDRLILPCLGICFTSTIPYAREWIDRMKPQGTRWSRLGGAAHTVTILPCWSVHAYTTGCMRSCGLISSLIECSARTSLDDHLQSVLLCSHECSLLLSARHSFLHQMACPLLLERKDA